MSTLSYAKLQCPSSQIMSSYFEREYALLNQSAWQELPWYIVDQSNKYPDITYSFMIKNSDNELELYIRTDEGNHFTIYADNSRDSIQPATIRVKGEIKYKISFKGLMNGICSYQVKAQTIDITPNAKQQMCNQALIHTPSNIEVAVQ